MNSPGPGRLPISAFCVWEIPDRGIAVHLHLSAVEWLDYEIRESLRAPAGAEVGGLLLGRIESKAWNKITIEGFTPVLCDYESGSSYHLSESDKNLLQEQLFRWQRGPGRNLYVVGFYRSHNREEFRLDAEDLSLAKEFFSDSAGVFLLIKPVGQRDRVGALFLCDEGHVDRECNLLFPFSRSRLTRGETTLDSFPEVEEQDMHEGAGAPYFAPVESESDVSTSKTSPRRRRVPAEEKEFGPGADIPRASQSRSHPTPREKALEPEEHSPKPTPRRTLSPPEQIEFEPEEHSPKPPPLRKQSPPEEKELELEEHSPKPPPLRKQSPPEEKELELEEHSPKPPPRRKQSPPEEKEFEPETRVPGPAPPSFFPPEGQNLEEFPQAAGPAELEFVSSRPPVFAPLEWETPRWRSWVVRLLVAILILAGGALGYQFLRGSGIPEPLAGLFSGLGWGGYQVSKKPETPGPQNPDALGLEVALDGNSLRVSWNKESPSIVTAKRGSLSIWNDDTRREEPRKVPVGVDQLRTGSVDLSHDSSQAIVRLEVFGENGATTGEMASVTRGAAGAPSLAGSKDRIPEIKIAPPSSRRERQSRTRGQAESSGRNQNSEASKLALARATPGRTSPETGASSTRGRTSPGTSASSTVPQPPVPSPDVLEQKPAVAGAQRDETQRPRPAVPEQGKPVPPPPTEAASTPPSNAPVQRPPVEPPLKLTEAPRQPDNSRTAQEQPPGSASREPAKQVAQPEKVLASPPGVPSTTQSGPATVTPSEYVPPRAVRQVKPATPSNVRNLISEDVQINIKVEIDATGRVVRAEPVSRGKQDYLTSISLEAARQWRFAPARQGTQNVASSVVVGFQFKKD